MKKQGIDIPLSVLVLDDISAMIEDLRYLQGEGHLKCYACKPGQTAEQAIFAVRVQISNLVEEDDELEAELLNDEQ